MTRVGEILDRKLNKEVYVTTPETPVIGALREMAKRNVGALVVLSNGKPVGIISERDVARRSSDGMRVDTTPVSEVMIRDVIVGMRNDEISYVMSIMTASRIRHLPIIDGQKMIGILSIGDVVKAQISDAHAEIRMLHDYIDGKYPG